jgi:hypothetical protein
MPYRRLPNTDKARSRALERAYKRLETDGSKAVPFSEQTSITLRTFVIKFQRAIISVEAAKNNQVQKNKDYMELQRKARLYVSHYIQVMNFGILRGELKPEIRSFYRLNEHGSNLPPLNSENDLIIWGKKIIEGDQQRIAKGGSPFYNPSIALVKVNFEKYIDAYHYQKTLQASTDRYARLVIELRHEADDLILKIWNEVETAFEHLPDAQKRKKAEYYGVVYVYRKNELHKINTPVPAQVSLLF